MGEMDFYGKCVMASLLKEYVLRIQIYLVRYRIQPECEKLFGMIFSLQTNARIWIQQNDSDPLPFALAEPTSCIKNVYKNIKQVFLMSIIFRGRELVAWIRLCSDGST